MITIRTPNTAAALLHIRWGIRRDLPDVMRIERASFEYAWSEDEFLTCLRQRNCIIMVAERGDAILGFMVYELHRDRMDVLNFAVDPAHRRKGVGSAMVDKLISKLAGHRRERLVLRVREGNTPAHLFFTAMGFLGVRVLRNHFEDSGEDAYVMQYRATPTR